MRHKVRSSWDEKERYIYYINNLTRRANGASAFTSPAPTNRCCKVYIGPIDKHVTCAAARHSVVAVKHPYRTGTFGALTATRHPRPERSCHIHVQSCKHQNNFSSDTETPHWVQQIFKGHFHRSWNKDTLKYTYRDSSRVHILPRNMPCIQSYSHRRGLGIRSSNSHCTCSPNLGNMTCSSGPQYRTQGRGQWPQSLEFARACSDASPSIH
jgi:hypothetical protein